MPRSVALKDKDVAKYVARRLATISKNEPVFGVTVSGLRDYVKQKVGKQYKVKDFRTAKATLMAEQLIRKYDRPTTQKEYKAIVREIADAVAETLGNTRTVALQSYIDPRVFEELKPSD